MALPIPVCAIRWPVAQLIIAVSFAAASDVELATYRGHYRNIDYGYTVEPGFFGKGSAVGAPNHGFVIDLGDLTRIWVVDSSYENPNDSPHVFGRFNTKPGPLTAERKQWRTRAHGHSVLHILTIARVFDRKSPIIYTVGLDFTADDREKAQRLFNAMIDSFRLIPVGP
jgi:hypothetical protein